MDELRMATNQKTLDVAIAVKPLTDYLAKMGIITTTTPAGGHIQLTAAKFREIWPDVTPDSDGCLCAVYDGNIFVAWGGDPND